ncbi:MAG: nucleotide sugar dehydrogenase [Thermoleophilaceae bacterium]
MAEKEPIGVIGTGYVGLVQGTCLAELGHEVWCRDIVQEKVDALNRGEVPIYEPGLAELIEKNRERLHFTTDMGEVVTNSRLLFCCVDTPPTYSGDADLSRVERVVEEIGDLGEHALVMKSTVPVGTGRAITRGREELAYVSNPEFLKEGSAVHDFMQPDRVVVGADDTSQEYRERVAALYEPLGAPIIRTDVASAEMVKLASNAFLATKISFINEIANVSEELGADVTEVARGMGLDSRIGPKFLQAGIGYGGSCLVGDETVLIRLDGRTELISLEDLFGDLADDLDVRVVHAGGLEVLAWTEGRDGPEFGRVSAATRTRYSGEILRVRTATGHSVRCTPDHPFVVAATTGFDGHVKLARELSSRDWLPLAQGEPARGEEHEDATARTPLAVASRVALSSPRTKRQMGVLDRRQADEALRHLASDRAVGRVDERGTRLNVARAADDDFRRGSANTAWVQVTRVDAEPFDGFVYSLEVPGAHTFVTTGGLVTHNCFPKDVQALKQLAGNTGYHFQLLTSVIEVNELQKRRTVGKLQKHLGPLVGKTIALLGVAFKPNTDDIREATSLVLAGRLRGEGANVRVYDPIAADRASDVLRDAEVCDSAEGALAGADAAVLVTEWPEFRDLDWAGKVKSSMNHPIVIDGRNFLDRDALQAAGFTYEGVGR